MKLETWLKLNRISIDSFANKIDKDKSLVHRYVYEGVIPKSDTLARIYLVTFGAVTANDFHMLSDKIFEENIKNENHNGILKADSFR